MSSLLAFLQKRKEDRETFGPMKTEWLQALHDLFQKIKGWLQEPIKKGLLFLDEMKSNITEEGLGSYEAPSFHLRLEKDAGLEEILSIRPLARRIIGYDGRIDITYRNDRCLLLRKKSQWLIGKEEKDLEPLEQASFEKAIQSLFQD